MPCTHLYMHTVHTHSQVCTHTSNTQEEEVWRKRRRKERKKISAVSRAVSQFEARRICTCLISVGSDNKADSSARRHSVESRDLRQGKKRSLMSRWPLGLTSGQQQIPITPPTDIHVKGCCLWELSNPQLSWSKQKASSKDQARALQPEGQHMGEPCVTQWGTGVSAPLANSRGFWLLRKTSLSKGHSLCICSVSWKKPAWKTQERRMARRRCIGPKGRKNPRGSKSLKAKASGKNTDRDPNRSIIGLHGQKFSKQRYKMPNSIWSAKLQTIFN